MPLLGFSRFFKGRAIKKSPPDIGAETPSLSTAFFIFFHIFSYFFHLLIHIKPYLFDLQSNTMWITYKPLPTKLL